MLIWKVKSMSINSSYTYNSNASLIRVAPPVSSHEYSNASKFNPKSADFRWIFQQLITLLKRKIFKQFFFLWATAKVKVSVYPRILYKCCYFAKEFVGWKLKTSRFYRSQSITLMPVMFLGKLTCVASKNDVILQVQPRTPYVN